MAFKSESPYWIGWASDKGLANHGTLLSSEPVTGLRGGHMTKGGPMRAFTWIHWVTRTEKLSFYLLWLGQDDINPELVVVAPEDDSLS